MNGTQLYNSIKNGETCIDTLSSNDISVLFNHLCACLEQGEPVDDNILSACESKISLPDIKDAEDIMSRAYKRTIPRRIRGKGILRRVLTATLTAVLAAALCLGTAYAFGVDIVGEIHTMLSADYPVVYEKYDSNKHTMVSEKYSLSHVFEKEFSDYIYPSYFPEGVVPVKVTENSKADGRIYTVFLAPSSGESWQIFACPADESYLPMGYKFSASYGENVLDFVYTVSHSTEGITGYKLYTIHNDVQYSFYLYTSDWDEVKTILNNLIIP